VEKEKIVTEENTNPDAQSTDAAPDNQQSAQPVDSTPESAVEMTQVDNSGSSTTPENHDDSDVAMALQRDTQDGKGDGDLPDSDFNSYATDGVEKEGKS
jgi:hypothetical protein